MVFILYMAHMYATSAFYVKHCLEWGHVARNLAGAIHKQSYNVTENQGNASGQSNLTLS